MDALLVGLLLPTVENHSLAVLRSAVEAAGFRVGTVGFGGWNDLDAAIDAALRTRPRLVGVSLQNTEAALATLSLTRLLRARGFAGRIVVGGHFATLNAADLLAAPAGVDVVVRFAGEAALVGLLRGEDPATLPGVVYRDADGTVREGAPPRVSGGDGIPRAARPERLPLHLGFPAADLVVSRGCEARCAYCCVAAVSAEAARAPGGGYARAPVAGIADEMAWLWHERGARVFNVMDDNLLPLEPAEAEAFVRALADALARRGVGRLALSLQLRADVVTDGVADALAALGLVRAYVGIDGLSSPQLRALGRSAAPAAGPRALERLAARGVFAMCNALLFGPTIDFPSVQAELEGLAQIRGAPVHLLPIDARAGTVYFARAALRGLMEGGPLWRHYRFADERTARVADVVVSMPTRLVERSVPIALYDLGYNLGIARRLVPGADLAWAEAAYFRISEAWNRDQLRLLGAAARAALDGDDAVARLKAEEAARVRAHDEALVQACDETLAAVERAVSLAERRGVRAHARGRILSSVALAMSLAACRTQPYELPQREGAAPIDAAVADAARAAVDAARACPPGLTAQADVSTCLCPFGSSVRITFDAVGIVTSVTRADGSPLPPDVQSCLVAFFKSYCYPSLAGTTKEVLSSHCWVA
jgi:hypothetical protein